MKLHQKSLAMLGLVSLYSLALIGRAIEPDPNISMEQLAAERNSLQDVLNSPKTDPQTKALVREMLDWNAMGRSFAEFQRLKGLKPAATHQSEASTAGDAIFGSGQSHVETAVGHPATGGHIPAPKHMQRISVAGEESGMPVALGASRRKFATDPLQPLAETRSSVSVSAVRRGDELGASAVAVQALPAIRPADAAGGHIPPPVMPAARVVRVGDGNRLDGVAVNTAREAKSAGKKDVASWIEDQHFGPIKPMQPLGEKVVAKHESGSVGRADAAAKPAVGVWAEANTVRKPAFTAEKKVYTGPDKEIGGKGEFVLQQLQKDQDVNRVRLSQMTEAPAARGKSLAPADVAILDRVRVDREIFNPRPDALAPTTTRPMTPGVSYHTPPPGYRGSDVLQQRPTPVASVHTPPPKPATTTVAIKPAPQIMMVDSFCPKHGKYGGQYKVGEKVECPQCKAEKGKPVAPSKPQIMMVDAFCPKHGPYGGQYKVGEKVECQKCKADKLQALTASSRPAPATVHMLPPKPAETARPGIQPAQLKPAAPPQIAMVDAFCPKHKIKYGGQLRPGDKLECPKCKAEKLHAAVTTVHTPPPKPAVATVMNVDAFCPKHNIKYGGQIRPGDKLECPKCKAEKIKPTTGYIR